ncbi:MAG: YkoF family thiamine/hydroxymethylpyrimidine-binding protein [Cellvibrionaceae bacterium]
MKISVDLSLYPLKDGYIAPIKSFIAAISNDENIEVQCNRISTQVFGEYDHVMNAIQRCMKDTFENEGTFVMISKILNTDRS